MLARLGDVLYWLGCGVAVLFILAGVAMGTSDNNAGADVAPLVIYFGGGAIISWLIGRACRYVLSGT